MAGKNTKDPLQEVWESIWQGPQEGPAIAGTEVETELLGTKTTLSLSSPARSNVRDPTDTGVRVWVKATQFLTCSAPAENNHRRGVYGGSSLSLTCLSSDVTQQESMECPLEWDRLILPAS